MKIAIAILNCGDGSARVEFFKNAELAEKRMEKDNERYCEDIYTVDLPLDESKIEFHTETEQNDKKPYFYPKYYEGQLKR